MSDDLIPSDNGNDEGGGAPAWVTTFADLMSLLLCFFVLLLSFSEMDVAKFKLLMGSMKEAFGVQADIEAKIIPKGTSIVAQEFSPGRPKPTVINEVRQITVDSNQTHLECEAGPGEEEKKKAEALMRILADALDDEIEAKQVDLELDGPNVIIHVMEKDSFESGSAVLEADFKPVLDKIRTELARIGGDIIVSGHTDDVPIVHARRFRSNWELAAARAVSVAHELMDQNLLEPHRFSVNGYADTRPVAPNDSPENRARNRRVDITIVQAGGGDTHKTLELPEAGGEPATPPDGDGGA